MTPVSVVPRTAGADFRFYNGGDDLLVHAVRVWPVEAGK